VAASLHVGPPELSLERFRLRGQRREGIAVDWPIRYADIAPWYDHVERHGDLGSGRDGAAAGRTVQPPMALNCGEEMMPGGCSGGSAAGADHPGRTAN